MTLKVSFNSDVIKLFSLRLGQLLRHLDRDVGEIEIAKTYRQRPRRQQVPLVQHSELLHAGKKHKLAIRNRRTK